MFLTSFSDNCSLDNSSFGFSIAHNASASSPDSATDKFVFSLLTFFFSVLAIVANGLSVVILTRRNSSQKFGQLRLNLLILSISETSLNVFIASYNILNLLHFFRENLLSLWTDTLLFWNITSLISNRNWIVILIACSRCEIVFMPFHSVSGLRFNNKVIRLLSVVILAVSYLLSSLRLFSKRAVICTNLNRISVQPFLNRRPEYIIYETYCYFTFQSVLPVLVVGGISVAMTYSLLIKEAARPTTAGRNSHSIISTDCKLAPASVRGSSQRKATKTIFVLAIVFTCFETPVFIIQILMKNHLVIPPNWRQYIVFIFNLLVVLDSCSNFMVYLVTSDKFRNELQRLFLRPCLKRRRCHQQRCFESGVAGGGLASGVGGGGGGGSESFTVTDQLISSHNPPTASSRAVTN